MTQALDFDRWMQAISNVIERVAGLSVHDLADWPFRDSYDRGDFPGDVAKMMLEESGFYSQR